MPCSSSTSRLCYSSQDKQADRYCLKFKPGNDPAMRKQVELFPVFPHPSTVLLAVDASQRLVVEKKSLAVSMLVGRKVIKDTD